MGGVLGFWRAAQCEAGWAVICGGPQLRGGYMTVRREWRWSLMCAAALAAACGAPESQSGPDFGKGGGGGTTAVSVTATNPSEATQDTTLDVSVVGSGFDAQSSAQLLLAGVPDARVRTNSTHYLSSTSLVANVTIAVDAPRALYDVAVTTGSGKKGVGTELFVVTIPAVPLSGPTGVSKVQSVSSNGLMAGNSSSSCPSGMAPAVWSEAGVLTTLPDLPGTCGGFAHGVNSSGVVVGTLESPDLSRSIAVRWALSGGVYTAEALPLLPSGNAGPWAINASGIIADANGGYILVPGSSAWQLLKRPSGATICRITALNNVGEFGGRCTINSVTRAIVWPSNQSDPVVLPVLAGSNGGGVVSAINDFGVVVGTANFGTRTIVVHPVQWTGAGSTWSVAALADLGAGGSAEAVTPEGVIVGSVLSPKGSRFAAVWSAPSTFQLLGGTDGTATGFTASGGSGIVGGYVTIGRIQTAATWRLP